MSKPANRLGRGLSTLIPTRDIAVRPSVASGELPTRNGSRAAAVERATAADRANEVRELPIEALTPNPRQPRATFREESIRELADSIRANGLLQPVIVRATATDDRWELVAGERRWRAAKLAGLATLPAIVRELSDSESLQLALVENLQREDLAPLERAAAYQHYLDTFGGTIEDLAARLSESRANISNYLRLLKLRPEICYMLGAGELGMGQARAIAAIVDPQRQLALAKLAARRNLSVRQVEELARQAGTSEAGASPSSERTPAEPSEFPSGQRQHLSELEAALSKALGIRVRLYPGRRKNAGRVVIAYKNLEEFDRIAERLAAGAPLV